MTAIIYKDEYIVVCRKEAGLLSEGEGRDSLPVLLAKELAKGGKLPRIYPVHRLDRETEGLMVYALTSAAAAGLSADIAEHRFEKQYIATVCGKPESREGSMSDLLFYDRQRGKSFIATRERRGVKQALLDFELLSYDEKNDVSQVKVSLHTGRTHQIRVQFASRSMPLVGDRKYGGRRCEDYKDKPSLVACRLAFQHPITHEKMEFSCDD